VKLLLVEVELTVGSDLAIPPVVQVLRDANRNSIHVLSQVVRAKDLQAKRNSSRSALSWSLCVSVRPWGALEYTFKVAFLTSFAAL
jgi:hypothetical protein